MLTDKALQAVSAILLQAEESNSKALFITKCLGILTDLFDSTSGALWFSSGVVYHCTDRNAKPAPKTLHTNRATDRFSMNICEVKHFPKNLADCLHNRTAPPFSGFRHDKGICWTGNINKARSKNRVSEAELSAITHMTAQNQNSLMASAFDNRPDGLGVFLLSSDRIDHFTPPRVSGFGEILPIVETAFLNWHTHLALHERVKELTCLYRLARLDETDKKSLEEILNEIIAVVPSAWLYPEDARVRIILDERPFAAADFPENRPALTADIVLNGSRRGRIEIAYKQEHPSLDEGPFLQEERKLLDTLARELARIIDRKLFEKEKMEFLDRLKHADRLNMIGQLSAAVAHEINEPLTALLGYAQLAAKCPGLPKQAQADIDKIISTSLYAREIVRKLLMFSRKIPSRVGDVDINEILQESLHFFETRCEKEKISVELCLWQHLPPVRADLSQLRQVFSNLILNAIQAMPAGGRLRLETRKNGQEILVTIQDTGCGINREVLEKIFIPFFTTKPHYLGTGLGLPVVQEIVAAHGGTISVQSEPGCGTRFDLRFPGIRS